jgi:hypothetical protein
MGNLGNKACDSTLNLTDPNGTYVYLPTTAVANFQSLNMNPFVQTVLGNTSIRCVANFSQSNSFGCHNACNGPTQGLRCVCSGPDGGAAYTFVDPLTGKNVCLMGSTNGTDAPDAPEGYLEINSNGSNGNYWRFFVYVRWPSDKINDQVGTVKPAFLQLVPTTLSCLPESTQMSITQANVYTAYSLQDIASNPDSIEAFLARLSLEPASKFKNVQYTKLYKYLMGTTNSFCFQQTTDCEGGLPICTKYFSNTYGTMCQRVANFTGLSDTDFPTQTDSVWNSYCQQNPSDPGCGCLRRDLNSQYQAIMAANVNTNATPYCWYNPCSTSSGQLGSVIPYTFKPHNAQCTAPVCINQVNLSDKQVDLINKANISQTCNFPGPKPDPTPKPVPVPVETTKKFPVWAWILIALAAVILIGLIIWALFFRSKGSDSSSEDYEQSSEDYEQSSEE